LKLTDVSEVRTDSIIRSIVRAIIALNMETVCTSEALVNFNETTRCCISKGYHLYIRRRENLKFHTELFDQEIGYTDLDLRR
jgi:hypothetical protein